MNMPVALERDPNAGYWLDENTQVLMVPVKDLIPNPKNETDHSEEQIKSLAKIIKSRGFNVPIMINPQKIIIKGHGRRLSAMWLVMKEVPCMINWSLTPEQEEAERVADNQINSRDFDEEKMKDSIFRLANVNSESLDILNTLGMSSDRVLEISGLEEVDFSFGLDSPPIQGDDLLGLGSPSVDSEVDDLVNSVTGSTATDGDHDSSDPETVTIKEQGYETCYQIFVECEDEAHQEQMYKELTAKGLSVRVLTT